ncbi:MAG TPA: sugar ABC transporter permease [Rubrobacteraceae bacterium]|nr:sugar ABC transporter permease [Rubrobacteraceae bacterium]
MTTPGVERTGVQPPVARSVSGGRKPTDAGTLTPYLFMAPYLVLFVVFVLVPAVFGIWISLHNWDYLLPGKPWVGLENYVDLFTANSTNSAPFWNSMEATGKFTLYSVPPLVVIPLLVALILNQSFRGRNFFRAVYFAPYVLGVAVIGILWRFILDPNNGLLNYYLGVLGLPDSIPWTTALPWGWVALVGPTVWWTLGFNAVIYLTGLQDVDPALYDAAKVDGANRWQRFWYVTVPGLRPVFLFVVTTTILASANVFGQAYIITQGAPGNETRTAIMYIAQEGLRSFNMGSAAAMSYVLALALALVSFANFALLRYRED